MAEQNIQAISDMGQNAQKRIVCLYRVSTIGQVDKDDIPMQNSRQSLFIMPLIRRFNQNLANLL